MHPGREVEQVDLYQAPIDFRKSINGLSVLVEQELQLNPFDRALYVFINRQRNKIKVLYWHRNGFCRWLKRLEAEKFAWLRETETSTPMISIHELEWVLEGFDLWVRNALALAVRRWWLIGLAISEQLDILS